MTRTLATLLVSIGFLVLVSHFGTTDAIKVWLATWNVADNKKMDGKLFGPALEVLLGMNNKNQSADVYVVSLQQNCYYCNSGNKLKLANEFLKLLNRPDNIRNNQYFNLVDTSMTRDKSNCESFYCTTGLHGHTVTLVFAKQGLVRASSTIRNVNCVTGTLGIGGNEEKGVAGVRLDFNIGVNFCFAGLHLDSDSNSGRKNCLKNFFQDKSFVGQWSTTCSQMFLLGAFNTRTQYGNQANLAGRVIDKPLYKVLETSDEMTKTLGKSDALLPYLNQLTHLKFSEIGNIFNMPPTQSILPSDKCGQIRGLCYRSDRPPSWADRILCSRCIPTQVKAFRVLEELQNYSDHLPVVGLVDI